MTAALLHNTRMPIGLFLTVVGLIAVGCSGQSVDSDGATPDAASDVEMKDVRTSDTTDSDLNADTMDGGGRAEPKECVKEVTSSIYGFETLDSQMALSYIRFANYPGPDAPNCGALVLLEMNQGSASRLDHQLYDSRTAHVTGLGDRILVVSSKHRMAGETEPEQNILADVFTVQDRRLVRQNRTEELFHKPLSTIEFTPITLVDNGDHIVLVGRRKLATLQLNEKGKVSVKAVEDRGERIDSLEAQLESQWESLGAGQQFKPDYFPDWGRHKLTDDGFLIELEHGISTWDLSAIGTSEDVFESYIPLIYNLDHGTGLAFPPGEMWAYDPSSEILYLGEVADYRTLRDVSPPSTEEVEVVDLSDPRSPSIVARWNVASDFSRTIEVFGQEYPAYTYGDGKLFITFRPSDQNNSRMIVLESDAESFSVDELSVTTDIGPELQKIEKTVIDDGRFYATRVTTQPFSSTIRYKPLSEVLSGQ